MQGRKALRQLLSLAPSSKYDMEKSVAFKKKFSKDRLCEFLCVVPALAAILLLYHYPLTQLVRYSFTDWNMLKKTYRFVGWKNWKWLFTTLDTNGIVNSFNVTIIYTVCSVASVMVLGLFLSLLMSRKTRFFSFMRSVLFMPRYIAMSSIAIIFLWILDENMGVANYLLRLWGAKPVPWISSPNWAIFSLCMVNIWKNLGYNMMIYLSAMQGISKDYYEAAALDGAGVVAIFRKITLPLLSPTTAFLLVTQFIGSMKVFNIIDIMTSGGPGEATQVVTYKLYDMIFVQYRIDRASTVALVFFFLLMVVTILTMRWNGRKVNYDA